MTFVGHVLLRVGRTPLGKTPVGLTADLFTDPSFDQQPGEAVSHFNLVFLLGIATKKATIRQLALPPPKFFTQSTIGYQT